MLANKLLQKIIARLEAGKSKSDIAVAMGVHINTVRYAWKVYQERGTTDDPPRPGPAISDTRKSVKDDVAARIKKDPNISIRALAREFNVAEPTMRRLVKEDLGLKSLAKPKIQQLTPAQKAKRLKMCTSMLNKLKRLAAGKVLIFSDEKDFHLTKYHNRRNDRTIAANSKAVDPSNRFVGRPKFPQKAMFFGFVGSDGKAFPGVWIKGNLDAAGYKSILIRKVIPILDATYGAGNYIWTQDGASVHTANSVLKYLESKLRSRGFWSKGIWPPNSCNLNPLDYSVWDNVDKKANNIYHPNITSMKTAVEREWNSMDASYIRKTCTRFRAKLEACIAAEGGVFEKN